MWGVWGLVGVGRKGPEEGGLMGYSCVGKEELDRETLPGSQQIPGYTAAGYFEGEFSKETVTDV